jgi:pilus assembly protein FimV
MRSLTLCGALPLLAAPFGAWALSLGEIDIRSALNQPFDAEIELSATADEMQTLTVTLAGPEMFARYGLDRPAFLSSLEFRVSTNAAGRAVVRVSSRQAIAEPFIEILVEASSRSGRQLRQYTAFLDPPTFLPSAPVAVQPAQTRAPQPSAPGGAIARTPEPEPRPVERSPSSPATSPAARPAPGSAAAGGTYGPVQNAETLWGIATQFRPANVTMNQMMVAVYQANPQAFMGNMNVLRRGAILRIPEFSELESVGAANATAEVQRQFNEWQGRPAQQEARLILVPPSDDPSLPQSGAAASSAVVAELQGEVTSLQSELSESRRLLELRNEELRLLQEQLARDGEPAATPAPDTAPATAADPGVDLESEQLFADEAPIAVEEPVTESAPAPAPVPAPSRATQTVTTPEPSLVDQILGWLAAPIVWIVAGGAVVVLGLLLFLRRRRETVDDVTGQWEALEAEAEEESNDVRSATARMRRQAREEDFLVHEQHADADEESEPAPPPRAARSARKREAEPEVSPASKPEPEPAEQTLSSQTVINLDQADPVAEADFHMAYGLYDQAADLVAKALQASPDSRELKLKLLEVFFVWGNKESFLKSAESLRKEMGSKADADWDKVIIMGKQICPDEALFADATAAAGEVDLDLVAGDAPALDFAFDDASGDDVDLDLGGFDSTGADLEIDVTAENDAVRAVDRDNDDAMLDIGERTQAGLDEALFKLDETASATTPDLNIDSLAVTQESPTVETAQTNLDDVDDWSAVTMESPTIEASGPGTATVESPSFEDDDDYATVETPTIESPMRGVREDRTVQEPAASSGEYTAELNLDDLGLDIADVDDLPHDLGDLPSADDGESDTSEQPAFGIDSDLLSATGVTQVLRDDDEDLEHLSTEVLEDDDATMMAPGFESEQTTRTAVLDSSLGKLGVEDADEDDLDLNLDDFSAALQGSDTVEQRQTSSFGRDVFDGGSTPVDLDIGADVRSDDEPTGTEEVGPLDPQTMTEVGTKLDLARAYIDMGDPEGARSILEEVLDEGDSGQRREAQSLIDVLPA